jgi:intracellular multiplication protein IcmE
MSTVQADIGRQAKVVAAAIVAVTCAVGYIGYTYWSGSSDKKSHIEPLRNSGRPTSSQESEHYNKVLNNYNHKNASNATQAGDTYLSVMSTRAASVPAAVMASAPIQVATPASPAQPVSPPPTNPKVDTEHIKNVEEQVKALVANWTGQPHGLAMVADDAKGYSASLIPAQAAQPKQGVQGVQGVNQSAMLTQPIVPGYELVAGLLQTHLDTDETSTVEVLVPAGKYAGARVFALGYRRLENAVDMTFTGMSWQGRSYKINAKAVDEHTLRTALSGEVNHRWISRIMLPAIAAGIARGGQLYERSGTQTVVTPAGGVVQSEPETPSKTAVIGTMAGGIARQTAQVMTQEAAATPIKQVLVAAQTTVGVRFMEPVLAKDEIGASPAVQVNGNQAVPATKAVQPAVEAQVAASAPPQTEPPPLARRGLMDSALQQPTAEELP